MFEPVFTEKSYKEFCSNRQNTFGMEEENVLENL